MRKPIIWKFELGNTRNFVFSINMEFQTRYLDGCIHILSLKKGYISIGLWGELWNRLIFIYSVFIFVLGIEKFHHFLQFFYYRHKKFVFNNKRYFSRKFSWRYVHSEYELKKYYEHWRLSAISYFFFENIHHYYKKS